VAYRWRYQDRTGSTVAGPQLEFPEQTDAEDWLGSSWQELLDGGVDQVTLLDGDDEVYGPMSLHPPKNDPENY
jgi:hypothetical protein